MGQATERLLDTAGMLDDAALGGASLCAGWTRGHVLTHLARNADSLVNLLIWAHTGIETPQYASTFVRDADIAEGAPRPLAEQVDDLTAAARRFHGLAQTLDAAAWAATVRNRRGDDVSASFVPWMRLREVEIHHVDLAAGYTHKDWPDTFVDRLLPEVATDFAGKDFPAVRIIAADKDFQATVGSGAPAVTVSGTAGAIIAWLIGRAHGDDLDVSGGALPAPAAWK